MDDSLAHAVSRRYETFGLYQIIGGIIGYILLMFTIAQVQVVSLVLLLMLLFAFFLFGYSVYCGALLFRKKSYGLFYSVINQCLQLVGFDLFGYSFRYSSGLSATTGIDFTSGGNLSFGLGISSWSMSFNNDSTRNFIELNWVALIILIMLFRLKKMVEKRDAEIKIERLGS